MVAEGLPKATALALYMHHAPIWMAGLITTV